MKRALLAPMLLLAACSRSAPPARGPLLVLRFDNLTGDPALDWMGRGAARAIAGQIEGAAIADSTQPAEERQRAIAGGYGRILQGYLSRTDAVLRLRAELEDPAARAFPLSAEASGPVAAGLPPLAAAVARQLDPRAHPPLTGSDAALAAYIAALDSRDTATSIESLQRAIAADPDFALSYLTLIEIYKTRQDRSNAARILALARARGSSLSTADRARLDVLAAQLSGDSAASEKALAALSRLTPNDARLLRGLAESELQARRYASATGYFQKALAAQPGDVALLNALGYTQAYAGDLDGAVKTLQEYERVRPDDANPLDSLGDVNFYWNRFAEAEESYRQAFGKDPTFLNGGSMVKAAIARLFSGDTADADAIFAKYEASRRAANDPLVDFNRASWDYLRGKRAAAIGNLQGFAAAAKTGDLASLAHATLTVWLLESDDRARARQHAKQAAITAASAATASLASVCRFIAETPAGPFPNALGRAYGLLLSRDFAAALPLLREIEARAAPGSSEPSPVLLAWALEETGQPAEAVRYLKSTPVPAVSGPAPFESLLYPRIFHLRAVAAEKTGDAEGAARNQKLFAALSGG